MVIKRNNAFLRKIKDITISSSLTISLFGSAFILNSCDDGEKETVYTKGMQTYITEIDKDVFKIVDEKVVEENESKAIVKYLDGRTDTLTLEDAKKIALIQADTTGNFLKQGASADTSNTGSSYHRSSGLGNVLWWGGMGYLMGRSMSGGTYSGFYSTPQAYNRAQQSTSTLRSSAVTRPVNSRTGFFSNSRSSATS